MDLNCFPTWDGDKLIFVVCVFVVKRMYQGRPDVAMAKAYIDNHWQEEFNSNYKSCCESCFIVFFLLRKLSLISAVQAKHLPCVIGCGNGVSEFFDNSNRTHD